MRLISYNEWYKTPIWSLPRALHAVRLLGIVILIVSTLEASIMLLFEHLSFDLSPNAEAMWDAGTLAFLCVPFLYWLAIKPYEKVALSEADSFRTLLDSAPDGILEVRQDGTMIMANSRVESMFGYSREELVGQPAGILIPDRFAKQNPQEKAQYFAYPGKGESGSGVELFGRRKDGTEFPISINLSQLKASDGFVVLATVRDVTFQAEARREISLVNRKLNEQMQELQQRTRELDRLNEMGELLQACANVDEACEFGKKYGRLLFASSSGAVYLKGSLPGVVEPRAAWGKASSLSASFSVEDCWALRRGRIHKGTGADCTATCRHVDVSGSQHYVCVPLLAHGEALGVLHVLDETEEGGNAMPWAESKLRLAVAVADQLALAFASLRLRDKLRNDSIRDPLTGLHNRRFVEEWLQKELLRATRSGEPLSVIMFDVDHFKRFNDTFGHEGGDLILREVADLLRSRIRGGDVAARLGGEEFAIFLPGSNSETAVARAEAIRQGVQDLLVRHGTRILGKVTLSAGVSTFPTHGDSTGQLLQAADRALYQAKAEGRNRYVVAGCPAAE